VVRVNSDATAAPHDDNSHVGARVRPRSPTE
jgi:hypothetical protein